MNIGERIKKIRLERGLTQEQLATMIGVKKSTITGYEKGNRAPDVMKIKALASALSVSGDYLVGNDEFVENESTPSEKAMAIARIYDTLDADGQDLLDHVAAYASSRKKVPAGFRAVPVLGDAVLDGTVETREAARNEQLEMMTKVPTTVE